MSYILEALKKAQAERQLGSAPDIHAPAPSHAPVAAANASRKPLLIGLSAGIVIAGIAGALAWRAQAPAAPAAVLASNGPAPGTRAPAAPLPSPAPAPAPAPASEAAALPPAPAAMALAQRAAPATGQVMTPATEVPAAAPAAAPLPRQARSATPAAETPAPRALPSAAEPAPRKPAQPERAAAPLGASPEAVYLPAPALARAPDPAPAARAPEPAEDNLRTLQQLPEALQREVPRVSVGGYIYSPNPADRLLLVDKMLRREGDELAPGLVLERLLPKYAVMNYRGTRYRVAY